MDLSLALGRDVGLMPEREFRRWQSYARRKSFPLRRIELLLAKLCSLVALGAGAENASAQDFIFMPYRDEHGQLADEPEVSADEQADRMEAELMR